METAGLYKIQDEEEVETFEGYALSKGKQVHLCPKHCVRMAIHFFANFEPD